jgi:hypothetical protein
MYMSKTIDVDVDMSLDGHGSKELIKILENWTFQYSV